jgi:hypothetical protein
MTETCRPRKIETTDLRLDGSSPAAQLIEICRQVRRGQMPLKPHTWIHPSAKLTADDVKTLV